MDGNIIKVDVQIDNDLINQKIENLIDDTVMLEIHNLFAKMCDPYVPMDEGVLAQSTEITADGVHYTQPYAHYQYTGIVYGPNSIGYEYGGTPGWRSPVGKGSKYPTERELGKEGHAVLQPVWQQNKDGSYSRAKGKDAIEWDFGFNKEHHQRATHHWDKAMMNDRGKEFVELVKRILIRRAKELYG